MGRPRQRNTSWGGNKGVRERLGPKLLRTAGRPKQYCTKLQRWTSREEQAAHRTANLCPDLHALISSRHGARAQPKDSRDGVNEAASAEHACALTLCAYASACRRDASLRTGLVLRAARPSCSRR